MGRKKVEINPESGKRLSQLLSDHKIQQKELAAELGYTPQQISRIITGKDRLTEDFATRVVEFFKPKKPVDMDSLSQAELYKYHDNALFETVRFEWLMCVDDYRTEWDRMVAISGGRQEIRCLITRIMQLHGYEIVTKEFPVDVKHLSPEELEEYNKKPYNHVQYAIESNRPDRDVIFRILDHSEVEKLFEDIDDFIEFMCSKRLKRPFSSYLHIRKGADNG
ncbi:MAG: helix-turn-helix transcriptional regulator [Oscillibacter sp.]|nr:helix-turn-helix transcriptional regulator [Oscillibacter sp.]